MTASPARRSYGKRRLLATTALLGLMACAVLSGPVMAQDFLDNVNRSDALINPGNGEWSANSPIWSNDEGSSHDALGVGRTGILQADTVNGPLDIALTIAGTVLPGGLEVRAGNFTLTGGTIGEANRSLVLQVANGLTLGLASSLVGELTVEGAGTVRFSGDGSALQSVDVADGATLVSSGTTAGDLTVIGAVNLTGIHDGAVTVRNGGSLTSTGTITGSIANEGTAVLAGSARDVVNDGSFTASGDLNLLALANRDDAGFTQAAGTTLTVQDDLIDNAGTMRLSGTVNIAESEEGLGLLLNTNGATLALNGATINGGIWIREGATLEAQGVNGVSGNLRVNGDLQVLGDTPVALNVAGEFLLGAGEIVQQGLGRLTISAGSIELLADAVFDNAAAVLTGQIVNRGRFTVSTAMTLTAGLFNASDDDSEGILRITAAVDAGGNNVTNDGTFTLAADGGEPGSMVNVARFGNNGSMTMASGTSITAQSVILGADSTTTSAGTLNGNVAVREDALLTLNGGRIAGNVTNDGEIEGRGGISGTLTNNETGAIEVTGAMSAGAMANAGSLTIDPDGSLTISDSVTNEGEITTGGDLILTGDGSVLTNAADASLTLEGGTITGSIVNAEDGDIQVTEDSSVVGDVTNSGNIRMAESETIELSVDGAFTNLGRIEANSSRTFRIIANRITLGADSFISGPVSFVGALVNGGELEFTKGTTLTGDLLNQSTGVIRILAFVDADGFNVRNDGAMTIAEDPRGTLTNVGALTNSGELIVQDGSEVEAETVANEAGGDLLIEGTIDGGLSNASGGEATIDVGRIEGGVSNQGTLSGTGTIIGPLNNAGTATIAGSVRRVSNSGTLTTAGYLSVAGLTNRQQVTVVDQDTIRTSTPIENLATMDILGRVAGSVNNAAAGSLTIDVGLVTGAVDNLGTMTAEGSVGRALTNAGTLSTTGDLTVGSLVNSGDATIDTGDLLTTTGRVTNAGTVRLRGSLRGNLDNAAGGTTALGSSSRIAGSVENRGRLIGTATVTGAVTNEGQATLSGSTGDLTNTNTGTLQTQVRRTLEVGALSNDGTLRIGRSQRLTARDGLDNNGTLQVRGTLQANGSGITNGEDGTIALDRATVIASTINEGRLEIRSDASIVGDLTNSGTIDSTSDAEDVLVTVSNGTFRNSGTVQVSGDGFLTIQADEIVLDTTSNVDNNRVSLIGSLENEGILTFRRDFELDGDLTNADTGQVTILATVDAQGNDVTNSGTLRVGGDPSGSLTDVGLLVTDGVVEIGADGSVEADETVNLEGGQMTVAGTLAADSIRNDSGATLTSTGTLDGDLTNAGSATLSGSVGEVVNRGQLATGGNLLAGALTNDGSLTIARDHVLTTSQTVASSGTLQVDGRLTRGVSTSGQLTGTGRIGGDVTNSGAMTWTGRIDGALTNDSVAQLAGSVDGDLRNTGELDLTADLDVAGAVVNEVDGDRDASLSVGPDMVLTTADEVENGAGAVLQNDGRIVGSLINRGDYSQTGSLAGSLITTGSANLAGRVEGDVRFDAGSLTLGRDIVIDGTLSLGRDFTFDTGGRLRAGRTVTADDATLTLGGRLTGALDNAGTLKVVSESRIDGVLKNEGGVELTGDSSTGGSLVVSGLSGNGTYKLDVDLGEMTADRIVVRGGAATGRYTFTLNDVGGSTVGEVGRSVTLIDVDDRLGSANSFTFDSVDFSVGSERIVYDLRQQSDSGDLAIVSITNPAIGALAGNVSLTQTLIDSVVNRPTSPFVTGLAYDDKEKPCGTGAWGRATGGTANSNGAFTTGGEQSDSSVNAKYYGAQVGGDIACFDDRYAGWNLAFGLLAGVNHGNASQPVSITLRDVSRQTSVNETKFTQAYGGVYITATKDRWQADLQVRAEQTDFTVTNRSLVGGSGLGLSDADFKSTSQTVSGSVSYALPVGKSDWTVVPTAGFAWSRINTDDLRFDAIEDGITETLKFEDAERKIGFVGATVARSFVQAEQNSAMQVFATGTVYRDFADPSVSTFTRDGDDLLQAQRIESDNLGTYGELSLGANYIKVLSEGARARQFSASARIDARMGKSLDSVGVTGQLRWQF